MAWGANTTKSGAGTDPLALTTSAQVVYTAPTATANITGTSATARILSFTLGNANTTNTTYTIYKVPSGGTAGAGNALYSAIPFKNNPDTILIPQNEYLKPGDTIQALASQTGVNMTVSVEEYQ